MAQRSAYFSHLLFSHGIIHHSELTLHRCGHLMNDNVPQETSLEKERKKGTEIRREEKQRMGLLPNR